MMMIHGIRKKMLCDLVITFVDCETRSYNSQTVSQFISNGSKSARFAVSFYTVFKMSAGPSAFYLCVAAAEVRQRNVCIGFATCWKNLACGETSSQFSNGCFHTFSITLLNAVRYANVKREYSSRGLTHCTP